MDEADAILESAESALSKISAGRILDVATGSGGFITFLIDNLNDFTEIIGIDNSERPLEAARKTFLQEDIHFQQMDAEHMDFPDGHFDTVCIANSLHHMEHLPCVLAEIMRVSKPGGYIIISEMYRDEQCETQQTHVSLHHWWAAVDAAQGIVHYETFPRREVMGIIETLGLRNLTTYDMKDLEANPKEPELIHNLDGIIDRYIERCHGLEGEAELCRRGEDLRNRVHEIGFHGATNLLVIGQK